MMLAAGRVRLEVERVQLRRTPSAKEDLMTTARTVSQFLKDHGASYDERSHAPTMSAMRTAEACHVTADRLAKGVVLKGDGGYLLAVLPASHQLEMKDLSEQLHAPVQMASEEEIERLFPDCARGAVPPIGTAYGLKTIVDDSIAAPPDIYFEGGDHETLVHMSGPAFCRLLADAQHGRFSRHC
jgi:Ala-tRNA(Pro) deacylase